MLTKTEWAGERLWVLLNIKDKLTLLAVFPHMKWDSITRKRRLFRQKITEREIVAPERPEWYQEGMSADEIFERLEAIQQPLGETAVAACFTPEQRQELHDRLDDVLNKANVDPHQVTGFDVLAGTYQQGTKDPESGEVTVTTLGRNYLRLQYRKGKDAEPTPELVQVQRFESDALPYSPEKFKDGEWRTTFVLPDFQIGFRRDDDGNLDPFHDEKAIDVTLQKIAREVEKGTKIDQLVLLGDFLDLPEFGKYKQEPEFINTLNASLKYGFKVLQTLRSMLPHTQIALLEGNHDARLQNDIALHYQKVQNVKRMGEGESILTVPYLLGLDTLDIDYVGAYPAGRYFITPQLQCIHGEIIRKGATAKAVTEHEGISTIHGHTHRYETYGRTVRTYNGMRQTYAFSPGTLSRIDGAVPSVHGGTQNGLPASNPEDWQQGFAIVEHDGDNFTYKQVFINTANEYITRIDGETFKPRKPKK